MSSYYELMWRNDELTSYTTDKLILSTTQSIIPCLSAIDSYILIN